VRRGLTLVAAALVFAGCALRPRYADFITAETPGPSVALQLLDADDQPVSGAAVEFGEYRNKVTLVTDVQGAFFLPVDKKYFGDNPVLAVNPPRGVGRTHVVSKSPMTLLPLAPEAPAADADAGTSSY
jgi:hypothetical protein